VFLIQYIMAMNLRLTPGSDHYSNRASDV